MMDRITRMRWLAVATAATLTGCSWTGDFFQSDKIAYETAQLSRTPLEIPPDLSQLPRDDRFAVPDRPQTVTASSQPATRDKGAQQVLHLHRPPIGGVS